MDFLKDFRSSYGEDEPTAAMFAEGKFQNLTYPNDVLGAPTKSGYSNLADTSAIVGNLARLRIHESITNNKDGWPFAIQALALY